MADRRRKKGRFPVRRLVFPFAAAALAGCVSVEDLRNSQEKVRVESQKSPIALMSCIAQKIEDHEALTVANVRPTATGYQIAITLGNETTIFDLVTIDPAGSGAVAKYFSFTLPPTPERIGRHVQACR